jgi:hypothetical protein
VKSNKLRRAVLRAVLVSTLVCAINVNIIANKGTFSMFTSDVQSSVTMKTADTKSLIKEFNIVEEYGQQFIVIEPGELLKDNSIVYFEVTGEVAAYITQLNPITISKDKTPMNSKSMNNKSMQWDSRSRNLSISSDKQYFISDDGKFYIPIYINVNVKQKLLISSKNEFKGKITLRYLNGFINEAKSVSLSSKYLNSRWTSGTDYYFWENVKNTLSSNKTLAMNGFKDEFKNNFQKESIEEFNEKLDKEQIEIINTIAEGYSEYVSDLETKNGELLKQLEDLQKEKVKLISELDVLMKDNMGSSKELQSQIEALKLESKQLQSTIDGLKETIDSNTKAITIPPKDNGKDKEVTAIPKVSSGVEKKVVDPIVSSVENEIVDPVVISDAGNEKHEE